MWSAHFFGTPCMLAIRRRWFHGHTCMHILVIIYIMFHELVKVSKKICFIREKCTFETWVSSKKIKNSSGTVCTLYTMCIDNECNMLNLYKLVCEISQE